MGRVFKRVRGGAAAEFWTCEWNVGGKTFRKRAFRDKASSLALLRKLEDETLARRLGVAPPAGGAVRGLADLRAAYLKLLADRGRDPTYVATVTHRIDTCLAECRWRVLGDVTGAPLEAWLGRLAAGGLAPATRNGYLRDVKAFVRWACEADGAAFPLAKVKPANEQVDRRRSRRILTDAELGALIRATEAARPRWNAALTPADRAVLYRVAAYTGLRASELASLRRESFRLDEVPPVVVVEARDAKGKREEPVPVPAHLVAVLRPWLAGKAAGAKVWPGPWAARKGQSKWLAADLKRAGVAELDDRGRKVLFHSFKRRYVTSLIRAGAGVDEVRELARHRDVKTTLGYYTDRNLPRLGAVADRLPPPPDAA